MTLSNLSGVSCASATKCTAVGNSYQSGMSRPLAEHWNGTTWAIQTVPVPAGSTGSTLNGVSCTLANACTAVGYYYASGAALTLAQTWNGTIWTVQPTANPAGSPVSVLTGVWCTAATACTAAGTYESGPSTYLTLAEAWNGSTWPIQATANPSATGSYLQGVSCLSATACTAVGQYQDSSGTFLTLAEMWNGTSWTLQTTPNTGRR